MSDRLLGVLAGLLSTIIIGFSFIFVKIGLNYSGIDVLLMHRFNFAFIFVLLLFLFKLIRWYKLSIKDFLYLLLLSSLYPLSFFLFQAYGLKYTTASEASIVNALTPIISLILGSIFLKESTSLFQKLSVILSVLGIILIGYFKTNGILIDNSFIIGTILVFISVCSISFYLVLGRVLLRKYDNLFIVFFITIIAFIVMNIWGITNNINNLDLIVTPLYNIKFLISVFYLGVISTVITSLLTNYAVQRLPVAIVSCLSSLAVVFGIIGGYIFLKESIYFYHIIGSIIILLGVNGTIFIVKKK